MATLQIRDVPDEVYARLKETAEHERRSVNQQALYLLEQVLTGLTPGQVRRRMVFERARLRTPFEWPNGMTPEEVIREDRDR